MNSHWDICCNCGKKNQLYLYYCCSQIRKVCKDCSITAKCTYCQKQGNFKKEFLNKKQNYIPSSFPQTTIQTYCRQCQEYNNKGVMFIDLLYHQQYLFCSKCVRKRYDRSADKQKIQLYSRNSYSKQEIKIFLNEFCLICNKKCDRIILSDGSVICYYCLKQEKNIKKYQKQFIFCTSCQQQIQDRNQYQKLQENIFVCKVCLKENKCAQKYRQKFMQRQRQKKFKQGQKIKKGNSKCQYCGLTNMKVQQFGKLQDGFLFCKECLKKIDKEKAQKVKNIQKGGDAINSRNQKAHQSRDNQDDTGAVRDNRNAKIGEQNKKHQAPQKQNSSQQSVKNVKQYVQAQQDRPQINLNQQMQKKKKTVFEETTLAPCQPIDISTYKEKQMIQCTKCKISVRRDYGYQIEQQKRMRRGKLNKQSNTIKDQKLKLNDRSSKKLYLTVGNDVPPQKPQQNAVDQSDQKWVKNLGNFYCKICIFYLKHQKQIQEQNQIARIKEQQQIKKAQIRKMSCPSCKKLAPNPDCRQCKPRAQSRIRN